MLSCEGAFGGISHIVVKYDAYILRCLVQCALRFKICYEFFFLE